MASLMSRAHSFLGLPSEILATIASFLRPPEICLLEQTSRYLRRILTERAFAAPYWHGRFQTWWDDDGDLDHPGDVRESELSREFMSWKAAYMALAFLSGSVAIQSPTGDSLRFHSSALWSSSKATCTLIYRKSGRETLSHLRPADAKNVWMNVKRLKIVENLSIEYSPSGGANLIFAAPRALDSMATRERFLIFFLN